MFSSFRTKSPVSSATGGFAGTGIERSRPGSFDVTIALNRGCACTTYTAVTMG
jgi:hypothetical protein